MRIRATVKAVQDFQCSCCVRIVAGTSFSFDVHAGSVEELNLQIEKRLSDKRPHDMPYGWSSNPEGFKCDECNRND